MKQFKLYIGCALIGVSLILFMVFGGKHYSPGTYTYGHDPVKVIKDTTDERSLISVIYTQGVDTFAMDYLTQDEYNKLINQ